VHDRIKAPVTYLPEYLYHEPKRVFRAWRHVRRWPAFSQVLRTWMRDLRRDRSPNRVRRFGQALVLAYEFRQRVDVLYAHFLHTPASVTRYAAMLLGVPWAVSAHAKDVWTIPDWEKREKLKDCDWLVTCTGVNVEHLRALDVNSDRVHLAYHGLDFEAFGPAPAGDNGVAGAARPTRVADRAPALSATHSRSVQIVSVGRAVEKKGYDDLLEALARLPSELDWHFRHIGAGELRTALRAQAKRLGIDSKVTWSGALTQPEVRDALRESDLFVLASRITADGDRDGLPNVLMEACSQGLACVATRVSAIPELIEDGKTGLLVAPRDPQGLARAIALLMTDEPRRVAIGRAAQAHVLRNFQMDKGLSTIDALLAHSLDGGSGTTPAVNSP
jgi:glycosyltransferase involved in cell wall biosynthesis